MDPDDLALNCSLALRDIDPRQRASTAAALGYTAVEFWWPFEVQHPTRDQTREFVDDVHRAEVRAVLLTFPGGGPAVEDRGLLSVPGREDEFLRAAETAIGIGRRIGTRRYNPMAGNIPGTWSEEIGRASCRERVWITGGRAPVNKNDHLVTVMKRDLR